MIYYPSLVTPSLRHFHPPLLLYADEMPPDLFEQTSTNLDNTKVGHHIRSGKPFRQGQDGPEPMPDIGIGWVHAG